MTQHETITMDGLTFHLWYNTPQQRQMAIDEYTRGRHFGVMNDIEGDARRRKFGVMSDGNEPNSFGMQ